MGKNTILIVEDEAVIALNIKEMLEQRNFEIAGIASKGEEAVKLALQQKPDLILMDIILSGKMDGVAAYEKIKAQYDIPVIYLTAHSDEMTLNRAKKTEPQGYILKPISQRELYSAVDISLYKHKIAKKLKESEKRYRTLTDNSRAGIWQTNPEGYTIYINRAMCRILEIENEQEIIGEKFDPFFTPESLERIKKAHKKRKSGITSWYEAEIIGKKGTRRFVEISDAPVLDDRGKLQSVIGTIVDITERKRALDELKTKKTELQAAIQELDAAIEELTQTNEEFEAANEELLQTQAELIKTNEELAKSEDNYRTLSENSPAAVFKFLMSKEDGSFSFPFITKRIKELSGIEAEEIMKNSSALLNMIHPDHREDFVKGVLESANDLIEYSAEIKFIKDNEERWAKATGRPELLPNGDILWNGFLEDITDRKRAEKKLKESEEKFRSITEKSLVGVYLIQDGKFRYVNPKFAEIFGYSVDEMIDKIGPKELTYAEDWHIAEENIKKREGGEEESINYTFRGITKEKKIVHIEVFGTRTRYNEKPAIIGTLHDITKRITAEEKLKTSLQEKETLLKEIHHRVKNNMQVISSLIELQSSFIMEKTGIDHFKETTGRIKSMALIHEKLYHWDNLSEIDFKEYIKTLSSEISRSYTHPSCEIDIIVNIKDISLNMEKAIPCGLIINELITNSYKHAFHDQQKCTVQIDLTRDKKGNYHLKVSDNGIGLPKDIDLSDENRLGFQLVKALTEQLKGRIEIIKEKGTAFKITFPDK